MAFAWTNEADVIWIVMIKAASLKMKWKENCMNIKKAFEQGKNKLSNLSIMAIWMIAFLVTLLICAAGMVIGYNYISSSTNELIEKFNYDMMREHIHAVEGNIDNILNALINITALNNFDEVIRDAESGTSINRYDVHELYSRMVLMPISGVEKCNKFVFIPKTDIIIGSGSVRSSRDFFVLNAWRGDYSEWYKNILTSNNMLDYDAENDVLFFKRKVSDDRAIVVISIERAEFFSMLGDMYGNDFVICDRESGLHFSASGEDYTDIIDSLDYLGTAQQRFVADYSVCYQSATGYDWNYISLANAEKSMESRVKARNIMIICTIGSLLAGIAVGFVFIRRNNRNIYAIYNEIADAEENETRNEYMYIQNAIHKLTKQNSKAEHLLYLHEQRRKGDLLYKLLTDENMAEGMVQELKEYGVQLDKKYALLTEFVIYDCKFLFFEQGKDASENYAAAKTIVKNVYKDLFEHVSEVHFAETGRNSILMLLLENNKEKKEPEIHKTIKTARTLIEEKFNIGFKIYMSELHGVKKELSECYRDIVRIKEYRSADDEWIIDAEDFKARKAKNGDFFYYLPVEAELQIAKDIRLKKPGNIMESINRVFLQNEKNGTSFRLMKMLAMNIANTVLKGTSVPDKKMEDFFSVFSDFYEQISKVESLEEIKSELGKVIEFVCSQDKESERYSIIDEVKRYVLENYNDPGLNVNSIAEQFNVKLSTLSSTFKKQEGLGLLEYITRIRIDTAKKLIMTTNEPISAIAEKVGYTNERTFYRVFEKYAGSNPGKFRTK